MQLPNDTFIYRIPLMERTTLTDRYGRHQRALECDGVGFFVKYENEDEITPVTKMRGFLMGRSETHCYVIDKSLSAAIEQFYREWVGAFIGGEAEEAKAL